MLLEILAGYLAAVNLIGFFSMAIDKRRARKGAWRISEKRLFLWAVLGGSLGSMAGLLLFRHKTKHLRFTLGLPLIFLLQAALFYLAVLYLK